MEVVLRSESRRLNFHGQPGRETRMRLGAIAFLFRMTRTELLLMHEASAAEARRTVANVANRVIDQQGRPASPEIPLRQGDTIRFGRNPQFSSDGLDYYVSVEDAEGRLEAVRTNLLAGPMVQALVQYSRFISKNHATIDVMKSDIVVVNDLGSTNGTHLTYIGV